MSGLKEMSDALKHKNLKSVSIDTGISYQTLLNIRDGKKANPTYRIMVTLKDYLKLGLKK